MRLRIQRFKKIEVKYPETYEQDTKRQRQDKAIGKFKMLFGIFKNVSPEKREQDIQQITRMIEDELNKLES
jgi:hypothetical protein